VGNQGGFVRGLVNNLIILIGFAGLTMSPVNVNAQEGKFEVGNAQSLFEVRNVFALGSPFDVTPDGKRFLVLTQPDGSVAPLTLVLNWTAEVSK